MKKIFILMVSFLFIFSSINANEIRKTDDVNVNVDCYDQVYMVTVMADAAGYSQEEVEWYSQAALAIYCYGYSLDDIN